MKKFLPILIPIGVFLLLKVTNLDVRLSDTNIYFYTGYQLTLGKILYKDIFFTNFPLLPYASAIYYFLVGKSLTWFYFTPALEVSAVAIVIFLIVKHTFGNTVTALTSALLYLFSFIVLATSDHQTGVFLASLFAVLSYYFGLIKKKYFVAGIFIALALLTKAYFLPVLAALTIALAVKNRKNLLPFILGGATVSLIVLLPSLLFAANDLVKDVFLYSLTRSQGIDKTNIILFFLKRDFLLVVGFTSAILFFRTNLFLALLSVFSALFVLFYQDIYYLYLNFAVPFLCIAFAYFQTGAERRFRLQKMVIPTLVVIVLIINLGTYFSGYRDLQKLSEIDKMTALIRQENPQVIYGTNDIAPALAYLSDTPLLNGIVDTNENIFRKGYLNADTLTEDAVNQKAMIITHGALYPAFNVREDILGGIFDKERMTRSCMLKTGYTVRTEGLENRINFFSCFPE